MSRKIQRRKSWQRFGAAQSQCGRRYGRRPVQRYGWSGAQPHDQSGQFGLSDHRTGDCQVRWRNRSNFVCCVGYRSSFVSCLSLGSDALESAGAFVDHKISCNLNKWRFACFGIETSNLIIRMFQLTIALFRNKAIVFTKRLTSFSRSAKSAFAIAC